MSQCPFCERIAEREDLYATTEFAVAFPDGFPVSEGHTLVVPKRHVTRAEQLERAEWAGLFDLVREVSRELASLPGVEGVNVGVNSGEMIAGNVGSESIKSYTVIGDNVNLGARLESLCKEYQVSIIISEFTKTLLKDDFCMRELGQVQVKGKSKPVEIFAVFPDPQQTN